MYIYIYMYMHMHLYTYTRHVCIFKHTRIHTHKTHKTHVHTFIRLHGICTCTKIKLDNCQRICCVATVFHKNSTVCV